MPDSSFAKPAGIDYYRTSEGQSGRNQKRLLIPVSVTCVHYIDYGQTITPDSFRFALIKR